MRFFPIASCITIACSATIATAAERPVATLVVTGEPQLSVSVQREHLPEGGLRLRLTVQSKGQPKNKTLVLYEGGDDGDGPGDKEFRALAIEPFALPAGTRGVRVVFDFQVPGSRPHRQSDTFLVSIDDAPRVVLEATKRRQIERSKVCHEIEETTLTLADGERLVTQPVSTYESEVSLDDDMPLDKDCNGQHPGRATTYKFDGETFVQIDPPPAPKKHAPAADADDDD